MRIPLLLSLICVLSGLHPAMAQQDAAQAEVELDRVRQQIESLEAAVRESVAERGAGQAALREAELSAARASQRVEALAAERAQVTGRLAALQAEATRSRARLAGEQAALGKQLRQAYVSGREEWLRLLLSQQDPVAASRQLVYYGYLTRRRSEGIAAVRAALAELAETVAAVAAERARLADLEARQRAKLAELEGARAERAAAVAQLDTELVGREGQLARLRDQAADLEALVQELRAALAELNLGGAAAFAEQRGQLDWPAAGSARHRFGQIRAEGGLRWDGTVLAAPAGGEVRAVHHGRVVFADWLNGMGLLLVLDHGDGYMTLYGHNQDLVREVGEWVGPGELLGHVGDTGGQAEPGLYFEIRKDGEPVDPKRWMRR